MTTKNDDLINEEVMKQETVSEKVVADVAASQETEELTQKDKKKKKKYTVEELLAANEDLLQEDETGRKKKIKVKVKHTSKLKKREARMGYVFAAPWIIGAAVFMILPLALSFIYAFSYVSPNPLMGTTYTFNGIENFQKVLIQYKELPIALGSFLVRMVVTVPLVVVFSLLMALLLNVKIRGKGIFRTIYFLPVIVVSGPVMASITSESSSIQAVDLTAITEALTTVLPTWIASPLTSIFSSIIMILWYGGVQILIFLAALQKINPSLYEAAKIDGGSGWECFWKITLPTIKPMILLNAIYSLVFMAQDTNTNTIINVIEKEMKGSRSNAYGYAMALAWMYSLIVLILVAVIALLFKGKRDKYARQVSKNKRFEKKTRRSIAKTQRHTQASAKKFERHLAKQEKAKLAGKELKGGREDD